MFKIKRPVSWNASVEKLDAMAGFYRDVVGAEEIHPPTKEERSGGATVTITRLDLGGLSVGLFDWAGGLRPEWTHHTFEIEWPGDAEAVRQDLERRGIKVEGLRLHGAGPGFSITLRDPCGNRLELTAPAPEPAR
jgi:predicted enzyme related to lactoylglutathione lyase